MLTFKVVKQPEDKAYEYTLVDIEERVYTECDDPECPGRISCPQCGEWGHGADAFTQIGDHGMCRDCHELWQWGGLRE